MFYVILPKNIEYTLLYIYYMIKIKLNTHLKIAIGYIVLIVVLGFSGWLLYSNMRSQQNVSEASVIFMRRQNAAEQMIYSMLKVSTAERAVCLG